MPDGERARITNKNWVIATPMETGIAPRARAIALLDKIRPENTGEYGPRLSAVERQAMMTISTGVQAVAEGRYAPMKRWGTSTASREPSPRLAGLRRK
jgi:hypothetical protein